MRFRSEYADTQAILVPCLLHHTNVRTVYKIGGFVVVYLLNVNYAKSLRFYLFCLRCVLEVLGKSLLISFIIVTKARHFRIIYTDVMNVFRGGNSIGQKPWDLW